MSEDFPAQLTGFRAGSLVAGYRLEEQVGAGGMAVVFRARDQRLGRPVALKILAPALTADAAFRRRFIAESRAAAAVDDPHIIPVHEAGEAGGVLFIAMRFVQGGDLRRVLEREGALAPGRAAEFLSPVASALDAAHATGLVHRDVKPANILVDAREGRPDHVYLSDFGVSKGAVSSVSLTGTGQFLGTPDYSAPEQIQGRAVDGRADQYALACVAYQLLAGQVPFERDQGMAVLLAHLSEPPPSLGSRRPDLPEAADRVLARALAKHPEERYGSCRDFADALREALCLAPYYPRGPASASDHPQTGITSQSEFPGPATADTAAVPADPAAATTPSTTATLIPPVAKTMLAPANSAAGQTEARPDAGPAALPGDGGQRAASPPRDDRPRVAAGGLEPGTDKKAPRAPRSRRLGRAIRRRPVIIAATTIGIAVIGLVIAITVIPGVTVSDTIVRTFSDPGTGIRHVNSVAFSPDGKTLATGDSSGNAYLWSVDTGRRIAVLGGRGAKVFTVAFSPDGTIVAAGFGDGSTSLWNAATGQLIDTIADPGGKAVNSVAFSPDGKTLATGDGNGKAYLWDFTSGGHAITLARTRADPTGARIWALTFSPNGKMLAVGDYDGSTYLWTAAAAGSPAATYTVPGGHHVTAVAFSPDGKTLATGNSDGTAYLWSLTNGTHTIINEPGTIWAVAFSRSGTLAVGDIDGSTYLWDAATGDQKATLTDPASGTQGVGTVAFSPDGKMLAAGDTNGITYLWKIG
jgi:serine/threonine protein kinase